MECEKQYNELSQLFISSKYCKEWRPGNASKIHAFTVLFFAAPCFLSFMRKTNKKASSAPGAGKATLNHDTVQNLSQNDVKAIVRETVKDAISNYNRKINNLLHIKRDLLTPEEWTGVLFGGLVDFENTNISEIKETTSRSMLHYTELMQSDCYIDKFLDPLRYIHEIICNIEKIHNEKLLKIISS